MEKKRTVQRGKSRKKGRPKFRFHFGVLIFIFALSFAACFILYMIAANINPNFMEEEFGETQMLPESGDSGTGSDIPEPSVNSDENPSGVSNPVPAGDAVDASYFGSCCLITDSTLLEMDTNGSFSKANIFGSDQLNAANCGSFKIESSFGTDNVYEIVKTKKPQVVYIMLGSDIGTSAQDDMIAAYTKLVTDLHSALPEMKVYVMQYPPVFSDSETLTNEMVNSYNKKLLAMSDAAGVYCLDTNTPLKGENGALAEKYLSKDGTKLSTEAYKVLTTYIQTHVA